MHCLWSQLFLEAGTGNGDLAVIQKPHRNFLSLRRFLWRFFVYFNSLCVFKIDNQIMPVDCLVPSTKAQKKGRTLAKPPNRSMSLLKDPTFLFAVSVLAIPPIKDLFILGNAADALAYLYHPAMLFFYAALAIIPQLIPATVKLSVKDQRLANWWLVCAIAFHIITDCWVGVFHWLPGMDREFKLLDRRFQYDEAVVSITGLTEFFVHMPLCLLTYRAIRQGRPERYALGCVFCFLLFAFFFFFEFFFDSQTFFFVIEAAIAGIQMTGAFEFALTAVWNGLVDIPGTNPVGTPEGVFANATFSIDHIIYFWFGFVICELVWVVVPAWIIHNAMTELNAIFKAKKVE
jgi:hypothetical protein